MKKTTVRLHEHIHDVLARMAEQQGVSLNQLINYALVRFVSFEEAYAMLEDRAQHARPGAIKQVLKHTASQEGAPLYPADRIPPGFDRRVFEQRIAREAALHAHKGSEH
jgi:hypothetical protein